MSDSSWDEQPKILVVDDTEANLVAMKSLLKAVNATVITASSGNEALSLLLRHQFAIILLDVQMPDMDGFETAELIASMESGRQIPIIFVTAIEKDEQKAFKGYDLGAVDYLFKPIVPHVLLSKVNIFLRLHEQQRELEKGTRALERTLVERNELLSTVQNQNSEKDALLEKIKEQNNKLKKYGKFWIALAIAILLALGSTALIVQANTMNEKLAELNAAYKRFVPYDLLELLDKKDIMEIHLGDQVLKEMVVMFVDVRGFTSIAENLTPKESIALINSIFSTLQPAIQEYRGIINKYLGDGLMALFPHGADDAVRAAIAMLKNLHVLSQERQAKGLLPIRVGIGLDGGELMLGTVGLEKRMEQTVVADAVNVASRIESATKIYQANLLISGYVFNKLSNAHQFNVRFVDEVRVQGRTNPTAIYQLFDGDGDEAINQFNDTKTIYEHAVKNFRERNFEKARQEFQQVVARNKHDVTATIYLDRLKELHKGSIPLDWTPVRTLTSK